MELNRKQIVKAVAELRKRGLSNGGSIGYHAGWCDEVADLLENALALIRELTEENERLEDNLIKQSTENIMLLIEQQEIKADTVRKMQERLKEKVRLPGSNETYSLSPWCVRDIIDQIAKEIMEEAQ